MLDTAKILQLGGFYKIGYPGVCIVEGNFPNVMEFVRRIQLLRWKHMVVRGEEVENSIPIVSTMDITDVLICINNHRKLPLSFIEIDDMSVASNICQQYNLVELFQTMMKKY